MLKFMCSLLFLVLSLSLSLSVSVAHSLPLSVSLSLSLSVSLSLSPTALASTAETGLYLRVQTTECRCCTHRASLDRQHHLFSNLQLAFRELVAKSCGGTSSGANLQSVFRGFCIKAMLRVWGLRMDVGLMSRLGLGMLGFQGFG